MIDSVRNSLTDGPNLLFLALVMRFVEQKRQNCARFILAISGLARETNLLAIASVLDPARRNPRDLIRHPSTASLSLAFCLHDLRIDFINKE